MSSLSDKNGMFDAADGALDNEGPVYMVNLIRYRETAAYETPSGLPPCSGREAYFERYAPAFRRIAEGEDYGLSWIGNVRAVLVGTGDEAWDDIVIVRYASLALLRRIVESPAYVSEAEPHRLAAMADWKFIVTTQPALPG